MSAPTRRSGRAAAASTGFRGVPPPVSLLFGKRARRCAVLKVGVGKASWDPGESRCRFEHKHAGA